jgi:hypothetical protein
VVAIESNNLNVAQGKQCSASSTYTAEGDTTCSKAVDGVMQNRNPPNLFISGTPNGEWMEINLGFDYAITTVIYFNRISSSQRAAGVKVQLLNSKREITAEQTLSAEAVQTLTFSTVCVCENNFEGGNWGLVRRVKQGSQWHPATDDLKGLDVYGTYGSATSDSTFSIAYSSWLRPTTEFLFATG